MVVGRIFHGKATRGFSKIFLGVPKLVKFVFSHSKLRKQPFCWNFQNPRGPSPLFPPSDTHVCSTYAFKAGASYPQPSTQPNAVRSFILWQWKKLSFGTV